MTHEIMSVTEFKSRCSNVLEQLETGGSITITKRGKPESTMGAAGRRKYKSPEGRWAILFPDLPEMEISDFDMTWECVTDSSPGRGGPMWSDDHLIGLGYDPPDN